MHQPPSGARATSAPEVRPQHRRTGRTQRSGPRETSVGEERVAAKGWNPEQEAAGAILDARTEPRGRAPGNARAPPARPGIPRVTGASWTPDGSPLQRRADRRRPPGSAGSSTARAADSSTTPPDARTASGVTTVSGNAPWVFHEHLTGPGLLHPGRTDRLLRLRGRHASVSARTGSGPGETSAAAARSGRAAAVHRH